MHYIFESLFIGIYCGILYEVLVNFVTDYTVLLFAIGFTKRGIDIESTLHGLFCKFGNSCQRIEDVKMKNVNIQYRIFESIIEGACFIVVGYLLSLIIKDRLITVVFVGILIHITSEKLGLHKKICHRCIPDLRGPLFEPLMFTSR
jgi:hypothetical protein